MPLCRRATRVSPMMLLLCGMWGWAVHAAPSAAETAYISNYNLWLHEQFYGIDRETRGSLLPSIGLVTVRTNSGDLRADRLSLSHNVSVIRARGVQYGEHPVGHLRWQPPLPVGPWTGTKDATEWGDDCINAPISARLASIGSARMSESCLYLNVWAEEREAGSPLRGVMVWFHGGSFVLGGSSSFSGDPMFQLRHDVVLVTVNYRLGALGWLGGSAVQRNTTDGSSGNFGLQDTRLALKWIKANIRAFGGDPERVTILGESAGASIVATHMVSPRSDGMFNQAVMQSGAFDNYTVQADPEDGFSTFATRAGCLETNEDDALACLRRLPIWPSSSVTDHHLMPAISNMSLLGYFSPAVDGVELTNSPRALAAAGKINSFSGVLLGTNQNEGRMLMPQLMPLNNAPHSTPADLQSWLDLYYPIAPQKILDRYRQTLMAYGAWEAAAVIYTDSQYTCPTQSSAFWLQEAATANQAVYVYQLRYAKPTFNFVGEYIYWSWFCDGLDVCDNITAVKVGVGHGADVGLLFNTPPSTPKDVIVSRQMIDYWFNFVNRGDPNQRSEETGVWPTYKQGNQTMLLSPTPNATQLDLDVCDFWRSLFD